MIRRALRALVIALIVTAGCNSAPPLLNSHPSAESVAVAVLDALARNDRAALEALALSEGEFKEHVWPELPAARPERNLPSAYVWGDLHQKSQARLAQTLREHGGRRFTLVGVTFAGEANYSNYVIHREATFRVRDADGDETEIRVCGSMLEKDGVWKVFSYVVDE